MSSYEERETSMPNDTEQTSEKTMTDLRAALRAAYQAYLWLAFRVGHVEDGRWRAGGDRGAVWLASRLGLDKDDRYAATMRADDRARYEANRWHPANTIIDRLPSLADTMLEAALDGRDPLSGL